MIPKSVLRLSSKKKGYKHMKSQIGNYKYRVSKLLEGCSKYGACELTGELSADMSMIVKLRDYTRQNGETGTAHVSNIFCTTKAAQKDIRKATT